jgi:hypothetical protein
MSYSVSVRLVSETTPAHRYIGSKRAPWSAKRLRSSLYKRFSGPRRGCSMAENGLKPRHHRVNSGQGNFTVSYWRGLRAAEPGQLKLSDWDRKAQRLFVHRGKGSVSGQALLSPAQSRTLEA